MTPAKAGSLLFPVASADATLALARDRGVQASSGFAGPKKQCGFARRSLKRDRREIGGATAVGYVRVRSLTEGGCVAWVLRLVEIGAEGEERCAEVMEISRPDSLDDIADLGLTLADAKLVL